MTKCGGNGKLSWCVGDGNMMHFGGDSVMKECAGGGEEVQCVNHEEIREKTAIDSGDSAVLLLRLRLRPRCVQQQQTMFANM